MLIKVLNECGYEEALLAEVNRQLIYDPITGIFTNRVYRNRLARKGDTAGYVRKDGYIGINLGGKSFLAHRLAWLLEYGYLPKSIDHVNNFKSDNRISNLRESSSEENNANALRRSDNKLGNKGISYHPGGYYYCCVAKDKHRYTKYVKINDFLGEEQALEYAVNWVTTIRETVHGEFHNHGC